MDMHLPLLHTLCRWLKDCLYPHLDIFNTGSKLNRWFAMCPLLVNSSITGGLCAAVAGIQTCAATLHSIDCTENDMCGKTTLCHLIRSVATSRQMSGKAKR